MSDSFNLKTEKYVESVGSNQLFFRPYLNCFEQSDPFLINALKEDHIKQPSDKPYNFSVPESEVATGGQYGQPWYLDNVIFKEQVTDGFFIGKNGAW